MKKLSEKQKDELKQKINKVFKIILHIFCYLCTFIFWLTIIIALASGSCSPKSNSNAQSNSLMPNRVVNNTGAFYSPSYYSVGDNLNNQFNLYFDYEHKESVNTVSLYNYIDHYYWLDSNDDINVILQRGTFGNVFALIKETNTFYPSTDYLEYTGVGIATDDNQYLYLYAICYDYNVELSYAFNLGSFKYTDYTFCDFVPVSRVSNPLERGILDDLFSGKYTFISPQSYSPFFVFFNLQYFRELRIDYTNFEVSKLYRRLYGNASEIYPYVYCSNALADYNMYCVDYTIHGLFYYNGHYYNSIIFRTQSLSSGDKVYYRDDSNHRLSYTLTSDYAYYWCFKGIYFDSVVNSLESNYQPFYNNYVYFAVSGIYSTSISGYYFDKRDFDTIGFFDRPVFNCFYTLDRQFTGLSDDSPLNGTYYNEFLFYSVSVTNHSYYYFDSNGYPVVTYTYPSINGDENTYNYITNIFTLFGLSLSSILPLLSLQVIPGITFGIILFLPFTVAIILFVIKLFKR